MKRAFCKKPCTIGGRAFAVGSEIPMEQIAMGRLAALMQYGLITVEESDEPNAEAQDPGGKSRGGRRKA